MSKILTILSLVLSVITGRVTDGKSGVAGVQVSDGVNVAYTDSRGKYTLPASEEPFVFITTPSGYKSSSFPGQTCFYQRIKPDGKHDFVVEKRVRSDFHHKVVAMADPQIQDVDDLVPLASRAEDIKATVAGFGNVESVGIILGDMVGWQHPLYPRIVEILGTTGLDFRYVIGNHDMTNYGRSFETSTKDYEDAFGPTYYSFDMGAVHYVALDDCFYIGRDWYYIGYLTEKQLAWLEKDLARLEPGSEVVVCMHIPTTLTPEDRTSFSYSRIADDLSNKKALYEILKPFNASIISGHMHTNTNSVIADNLFEHNLGGLCGAWWCGDVCIDGCPPGYKVYDRDGGRLEWYYKGAGVPQDCQMKVYVDDPMHAGSVVAHVWDYDPSWKVELWQFGTKVYDMERFTGVDPHAYDQFKDPSIYKISWVGYSKTPNLFKAPLECITPGSPCTIKVTDRFGRVFTTTF